MLTAMFSLAGGCMPTSLVELPTNDEFVTFLNRIILYPDVSCDELRTAFGVDYLPLAENPADLDLGYEDYFIPTPDGETLHLWYLPTELNRGTVVVVQGSTGTMPCYLFVASLLVEKGWSLVMFDFRGFGESSGEPDIGKLHVDLYAVLDWAAANTDRQNFTLLGVSLGSLPAVTAAVNRPELVNGIILDSPVAMGEEIRRSELVLGDFAETLIDLLPPEMLPEDNIASMTQPLLLIEGGQDTITPPASVELFYERTGGSKELIVFPELHHATAPYHGTGSYSFYLERFLSKIWGQYVPFILNLNAS